MDISKYVNTATAADIVGVTSGRIRQWLGDGTLKGVKVSERSWLIPLTAVERIAKQPPPNSGRPRKGGK